MYNYKKNANFVFLLTFLFSLTFFIFYFKKTNQQPIVDQQSFKTDLNGVLFLGKLFCYPGYTGDRCDKLLSPANPWYTRQCPNLEKKPTFDENMPSANDDPDFYLCFSHPVYGVPQIPISLWKLVQNNEANIWKASNDKQDRGVEHLDGFSNYSSLPLSLGNYIEVGSGPFTQTQFIIERKFYKISLLEPGAETYMKKVKNCNYKNGHLFGKKVRILAHGAERLNADKYFGNYDTLLAINVIEHVWDAYKYLQNLYDSLKTGGVLIFHERFYPYPAYGDCVLGKGSSLHPIRLTKHVVQHFLNKFKSIYLFEGQTKDQIQRKCGEVGFYFIGKKI